MNFLALSKDLAVLELYEPLVTLPKHTDDQEDDVEGPGKQDSVEPSRVDSPRPGDKRRNNGERTGERADKRKKLQQTLQNFGATASGSLAANDVVPRTGPASPTAHVDTSTSVVEKMLE